MRRGKVKREGPKKKEEPSLERIMIVRIWRRAHEKLGIEDGGGRKVWEKV